MRRDFSLSASRRVPHAHSSLPLPPYRHALGLGGLISVCLHGLVLWGQWPATAPSAEQTATMELVLVNAQTLQAPLTPLVEAQQSLDGGGQAAHGYATSPLPHTAAQSPDAWVLAALRQRQQVLEARQQALLAQLQAQAHRVAPAQAQPAPDALHDTPGNDLAEQESQIINARIAALQARIQDYNAQPRRHFVGPAAAQVAYAAYVEQWRHLIETLGSQHYPDEARGRLYGNLQLTVHIRRDGSLAGLEIDRPSEHAVLNLAAQRIVRLAAPFAPLPPDVARATDVLAITRTWHFTDQRLDTTP